MFVMWRRVSSAFLTTLFAAVSLLGHGGLHALSGGHECHGPHSASTSDGTHGHGHHHDHGESCGHESHSHDPAGAHDHQSPVPLPVEHDHDDCLICQWFAQGQTLLAAAETPVVEDSHGEPVQSPPQIATTGRLISTFTRGPPTV